MQNHKSQWWFSEITINGILTSDILKFAKTSAFKESRTKFINNNG